MNLSVQYYEIKNAMKDTKNINKKSRRTGIIITLVILFIIILGVIVGLQIKAEREEAEAREEYENRPVIDLLDYVDPGSLTVN